MTKTRSYSSQTLSFKVKIQAQYPGQDHEVVIDVKTTLILSTGNQPRDQDDSRDAKEKVMNGEEHGPEVVGGRSLWALEFR